ncbi:MAG: queuosine precursor transporter [Bacteroidota bacterium]
MDKRIKLYTVLSSVFLTALILAEITGGKLIGLQLADSFGFTLTMGVIPFPVTFIVTDIINEYYGRRGIRFITFVGMAMILMALLVLQIDMLIPATAISPVTDEAFNAVFGVSIRIIIGSLTAYLVGQLVDIYVFHLIRKRTGGRLLWLRATGSTVISQLIDSFIVLFIAFLGQLSVQQILSIGITNYIYKFGIAVGTTPLLYLIHDMVDRYLGKEMAQELMKRAHPETEGQ